MKSIIQHLCGSILCLLITCHVVNQAMHDVLWAKVLIEGSLVSILGWAWWIYAAYAFYMMFYVLVQMPVLFLGFRYIKKLSIEDTLKEISDDFFHHSV
jgi:hypothetical protein